MDPEHQMANFTLLNPTVSSVLSPRLGKLAIGAAKPISTPHYIPLTSRGALPHLAHDIVRDHTGIGSVYVGLEDFIERQTNRGGPPIYKTPTTPNESALRKFIAAPDDFLLILGPRRVPSIVCPTPNTPTSVSVLTSVGFRQLSADEYVAGMGRLRPDIVIGMADLIMGREAGKKRREKMVDRTHAYTMHAAEKLYDSGSGNTNAENEQLSKSAFFAPILPLENTQQLLYLEELEAELRPYISGLALYESASLSIIPETLGSLPRLLFNDPATPHDILKEISLGADLLTLPFLVASSDAGMALDFVFPPPTPSGDSPRPLAYNLWSSDENSTNLSPLSGSCPCYTCKTHHRAYLNHLLHAKEMLAWTLLQIHNHHVMDNFFAGVRACIQNGTFETDTKAFHEIYAETLPERTGLGPRLRGYQLPSIKGPIHPPRHPKVFNRLNDAFDKFAESQSSSTATPDVGSEEMESRGFAEKKDS